MSKSLARVVADANARGVAIAPVHLPHGTRSAADAAAACGVDLDQIVKSVVLRGIATSRHVLFLTAGGNRVDADRAAALVGHPLEKADAASIRAHTGFAIGGVSPFGHRTPIETWIDPRLFDFETVWAAAGTPTHVFAIAPDLLASATGARRGNFTG